MKPAQVVVLCEDKQHRVFAYRFLRRRTNHRIRVVPAPPGNEMCTTRGLRDPAPPSPAAACDEYRRVLP